MTALVRYEAACAALEAAVTADEVMHVHVTARSIEAVGRVAKNLDFEIKGLRLRTRAEARLGEMLTEGEASGVIASRGGQIKDSDAEYSPATLKELNIDPKLSAQSRKLSGIGARAVNAMLDRMEQESRKRGRIAVDVILDETRVRNAQSRRQLAQELSDCSALQPCGRKFPVVYADPAWKRKAGIGNRAYENQFPTMGWDEILAMPVAGRVLPDAWLFLWIPRPHLMALHSVPIETDNGGFQTIPLPLAWATARAWGFHNYSTCFVWTKTDDTHPDDHGSGLIVWDQDEILCLFKRGRGLPMPSGAEKVGSNYRERPGAHSAKPKYYRNMISRMTGGVPVLELFAREDDEHPLPTNFFTWGNQSRNTAELPDHDPDTGELRSPMTDDSSSKHSISLESNTSDERVPA